MKPCPTCGDSGPWENASERIAHIRSHNFADCPECGKSVSLVGLGSHRRILHGVNGDDPAPADTTEAASADAESSTADEAPKPEPPSAPPEPAPAPESAGALPPVPADLCCPTCGKGPFETLKGYRAHERSHVEVECADCGKRIKANAVGPHRRGCPGPGGTKPARPRQAPAPRRAAPQLPAAAPSTGNYVRCIDCGQSVHKDNLDAHRRRFHRTPRKPPAPVTAAATPPERARAAPRRPIAAALQELIPGVAGEVVDRLARFAAKHELDEGADRMLVATATAGPWVVRAAAVGLVIAREHSAAVVVAVDDLVTHVRRQTSAEVPA